MNQEDNIPCRFDFLKVEEVVSTLSSMAGSHSSAQTSKAE